MKQARVVIWASRRSNGDDKSVPESFPRPSRLARCADDKDTVYSLNVDKDLLFVQEEGRSELVGFKLPDLGLNRLNRLNSDLGLGNHRT